MIHEIILVLLLSAIVSYSIVIDPSTNDEYARVQLVDDPRNINKVNGNNKWKLTQDWDNPLYNWYFFVYCPHPL